MNITLAGEELAAGGWRRDAAQAMRELLAGHPCFYGRAERFEFFESDRVLLVRGQVPSFYLKQVLQGVLRKAAGRRRIDNRVDVVSSDGLSSVRR